MKRIITLILVITASFANAQAYKGKGDVKGQVGLNLQSGGTGIHVTSDFGIGEKLSFGFTATYLLNAQRILDVKHAFEDRADILSLIHIFIFKNIILMSQRFCFFKISICFYGVFLF